MLYLLEFSTAWLSCHFHCSILIFGKVELSGLFEDRMTQGAPGPILRARDVWVFFTAMHPGSFSVLKMVLLQKVGRLPGVKWRRGWGMSCTIGLTTNAMKMFLIKPHIQEEILLKKWKSKLRAEKIYWRVGRGEEHIHKTFLEV